MKALRRFTARAHLSDRLAASGPLSVNLRWSWDRPTQDLFATIADALHPDEVVVQAVLGRVDPGEALIDAVTVVRHSAGGEAVIETYVTTAPLPVGGSGGHTVRVSPHNELLDWDSESRAGHTRVSDSLMVAVDGGPYALACAPDGAMWVTLVHSGDIARITEQGDVTRFPVAAGAKPSIITAGPDGAMWFTCSGADRIGRISVDGELRFVELTAGSQPFGPTGGPDGALWFTTLAAGGIGRLTADGEVEDEVHVGGTPSMIITGPDNALWCTLNARNAIVRLDPRTGKSTFRELPTRNAGPVGITMTHDDAVWFTEIRADQLGRIPMNDAIQEIGLPGKPHAVIGDDADGVWVSLWGADQLARVSGDGEITTFDLPKGSEPHGLAVGSTGAPWVALESGYVLRLPW